MTFQAPPPDSSRARLAKLLARLAVPSKSAALIAAERDRRSAREERTATNAALLAAIADYQASSSKNSTDRRINVLEAEVAAHTETIARADAKLTEARRIFSRTFAVTLLAPSIEAAAIIGELVEQIDEILGPLADCANFADANRLEGPPALQRAVQLRSAVFEMRKSLSEL
jgi:hypothetical protein